METQLTLDDVELLIWFDSDKTDQYWLKDENGNRTILQDGWTNAQKEYNIIKKLYNLKNDLEK